MASRSVFDENSHVVFVCEGTFEEVAVRILEDSGAFVFPSENIVGITRSRKAKDVTAEFLNMDYDWPITIVRVLDSRKESFELGKLYRDRFPVVNVLTHPEIEMLIVAREGKFADFSKRKMRPSDYCKQVLGFSGVKSRKFLERYWNSDSLAAAAREYKRTAKISKDEVFLADLIKNTIG
ncbi:hypothetical protein [Adlercreutzia sp. ZJ141]|uniref:hypothetical protein n=1 Tax=Adlercreutzia sp. ZJ141 TaxID=2709406 RepID=UPI0013EB1FF9|nr:hypothetical protein [Adlercreutzia sp. ZJ141]